MVWPGFFPCKGCGEVLGWVLEGQAVLDLSWSEYPVIELSVLCIIKPPKSTDLDYVNTDAPHLSARQLICIFSDRQLLGRFYLYILRRQAQLLTAFGAFPFVHLQYLFGRLKLFTMIENRSAR